MPGVANIGALTTQGIKSEFALAYQPSYQSMMRTIDEVIWTGTSDKLQEVFAVIDSATHPVRWPVGNVIPSKGINSTQVTVQNRDFGRRIYLPRNYEDDQTGMIFTVARRLGSNWGMLPERIFFQFIQDSTDADLLPTVPNSIDGNALYITSTRYGSSNGNVVSQSGSTTVQQIITDGYSVLRRMKEFQDTESQPFWDTGSTRNMYVFCGTSLELITQQAMSQTRIHSTIAGSSTTDVQTGAAATNIMKEGPTRFEFVTSQRITNSRLYYFLRGIAPELRPLGRQVRKGMNESQGNWATSDHTRDSGQVYVQYDSREGWLSINARSTIRVS